MKKDGFTLIEVTVSFLLLGVVAVLVITAWSGMRKIELRQVVHWQAQLVAASVADQVSSLDEGTFPAGGPATGLLGLFNSYCSASPCTGATCSGSACSAACSGATCNPTSATATLPGGSPTPTIQGFTAIYYATRGSGSTWLQAWISQYPNIQKIVVEIGMLPLGSTSAATWDPLGTTPTVVHPMVTGSLNSDFLLFTEDIWVTIAYTRPGGDTTPVSEVFQWEKRLSRQ